MCLLFFIHVHYLCVDHRFISELSNQGTFCDFFFFKNTKYPHDLYSNMFSLTLRYQSLDKLSFLTTNWFGVSEVLELFMTNLSDKTREKYWHELFTEERKLMNYCFSTQMTSTWYFIMAKVKFNWSNTEKSFAFRMKGINF